MHVTNMYCITGLMALDDYYSQAFDIFGMIALSCVCVVDLFIWLVCEIGEDSRSVSKDSEMSVSVDSESCTADVHLPEGGITH